jgi:predicted  nucleic acid-binding Zn-ribbon protein
MRMLGGSDKNKDELARLVGELELADKARKRLAAELAQAHVNAAALTLQIDQGKAELEAVKAALVKCRQRQKASVDRANRFKAKLAGPAAD